MISQLDCLEDLMDWNSCTEIKSAPTARVGKSFFPVFMIESATTSPAGKEMDSWLIRSGLSPQASLAFSRIGIYTDFS